MSEWSSEDDIPWYRIYKNNNSNYGKELNDKDIIDYFRSNVLDDSEVVNF